MLLSTLRINRVMDATQRSSTHYFQRPEPQVTTIGAVRASGQSDLSFLGQTDYKWMNANIGHQWSTPGSGVVRSSG